MLQDLGQHRAAAVPPGAQAAPRWHRGRHPGPGRPRGRRRRPPPQRRRRPRRRRPTPQRRPSPREPAPAEPEASPSALGGATGGAPRPHRARAVPRGRPLAGQAPEAPAGEAPPATAEEAAAEVPAAEVPAAAGGARRAEAPADPTTAVDGPVRVRRPGHRRRPRAAARRCSCTDPASIPTGGSGRTSPTTQNVVPARPAPRSTSWPPRRGRAPTSTAPAPSSTAAPPVGVCSTSGLGVTEQCTERGPADVHAADPGDRRPAGRRRARRRDRVAPRRSRACIPRRARRSPASSTSESAQDLANLLKFGALPLTFTRARPRRSRRRSAPTSSTPVCSRRRSACAGRRLLAALLPGARPASPS